MAVRRVCVQRPVRVSNQSEQGGNGRIEEGEQRGMVTAVNWEEAREESRVLGNWGGEEQENHGTREVNGEENSAERRHESE